MTETIDAGALCLSCGICCDGTLFGRVELFEDEEPAPPVAAMLDGDTRIFRQACKCFNEVCTIYQDRPRACRLYRCAVLRKVEAGDITVGAAQGLIDRAKAGCERLDAAIPDRDISRQAATKKRMDEIKARIDEGEAGPTEMMEMMQLSSFMVALWTFEDTGRDAPGVDESTD